MIQVESEEEFYNAIKGDKTIVVSFSAPWCGSCKTLKPKIEALANELSTITFIKVEADDDLEDLVEALEIESFPHFRVYNNGEVIAEYTGTKYEKVVEFIRSHC